MIDPGLFPPGKGEPVTVRRDPVALLMVEAEPVPVEQLREERHTFAT